MPSRKGNRSGKKPFFKRFILIFPFFSLFVLACLFFWIQHLSSSRLHDAEQVLKSYTVVLHPVLIPTPPSSLPLPVIEDDTPLPEDRILPRPSLSPSDEIPLWKKNAAPKFRIPEGFFPVAIVIDDVGINRKRTEMFIALPKEITLSFLTYGPYLKKLLPAAREKGHEVMLHVPMENIVRSPLTGPNPLNIDMTDNEIRRQMEKHFLLSDQIIGINNHTGSAFTADANGMRAMMSVLRQHNLLFLDSLTSAKSLGRKTAYNEGVPFIRRHIFLDNEQNESYILGQLARLEGVAKKRGFAVAIGHTYPETHAALKKWIPTLAARKIILVPLTSLPLENAE